MCRLTNLVILMVFLLQTCSSSQDTEEADYYDYYHQLDWPLEERVIGESTPTSEVLVSFSPKSQHNLHLDETTSESGDHSEAPKSISVVESSSQAFDDDPLGVSLPPSQGTLSSGTMDSLKVSTMISALVAESVTTQAQYEYETGLDATSNFENNLPLTESSANMDNAVVDQITSQIHASPNVTSKEESTTTPKVRPTTPQLLIGFLPVRKLFIPISSFKNGEIPKNSVLHGIPKPYFNPHKEPQRDLGNLKPISNTNAQRHIGVPGKVGQAAPAKLSKHGKKWNLHPRDQEQLERLLSQSHHEQTLQDSKYQTQ